MAAVLVELEKWILEWGINGDQSDFKGGGHGCRWFTNCGSTRIVTVTKPPLRFTVNGPKKQISSEMQTCGGKSITDVKGQRSECEVWFGTMKMKQSHKMSEYHRWLHNNSIFKSRFSIIQWLVVVKMNWSSVATLSLLDWVGKLLKAWLDISVLNLTGSQINTEEDKVSVCLISPMKIDLLSLLWLVLLACYPGPLGLAQLCITSINQ